MSFGTIQIHERNSKSENFICVYTASVHALIHCSYILEFMMILEIADYSIDTGFIWSKNQLKLWSKKMLKYIQNVHSKVKICTEILPKEKKRISKQTT